MSDQPKCAGAPGPSLLGTWDSTNPSLPQITPGKRRRAKEK